MNTPQRFLTSTHLAAEVGVSTPTVIRAVRAGRIEHDAEIAAGFLFRAERARDLRLILNPKKKNATPSPIPTTH